MIIGQVSGLVALLHWSKVSTQYRLGYFQGYMPVVQDKGSHIFFYTKFINRMLLQVNQSVFKSTNKVKRIMNILNYSLHCRSTKEESTYAVCVVI